MRRKTLNPSNLPHLYINITDIMKPIIFLLAPTIFNLIHNTNFIATVGTAVFVVLPVMLNIRQSEPWVSH